MKVLVSGSSGLVGTALLPALAAAGHASARLVRTGGTHAPSSAAIPWDPLLGRLDPASLTGFDAVVHLAGRSITGGPWSPERKRGILESRVRGTRLLATALAAAAPLGGPRVLVCASGVGFYGDRGEEPVTEDSPRGAGFLADVCGQWEGAAEPAREAGVRVTHLRQGMVLSARGGALRLLRVPFSLGLGGRLGGGRQWWTWISLRDLTAVILAALTLPGLAGPVNAVSPRPVRNAEFSGVLARVLRRPLLAPAPAWALRLALGEMAETMLLAGAKALPARLGQLGFVFSDPELEGALRLELGRPA